MPIYTTPEAVKFSSLLNEFDLSKLENQVLNHLVTENCRSTCSLRKITKKELKNNFNISNSRP